MPVATLTQLPTVNQVDEQFAQFTNGLVNLQLDIWQIEAERHRLAVLLRIRKSARAQLSKRYQALVRQVTTPEEIGAARR